MRNNYCKECGLEFRVWVVKTHNTVCDLCDPEKFKELHNKNIRAYKKKKIGQEHLSENTWFPKEDGVGRCLGHSHVKYRRQQK